ncbi:MAG: carbon storage regulator CsrA [Candidatus Kapabacteria bacterium]|nr:carbon storage regulator CsrA [Candidatus Kapabacteria bacterium]MBX7154937.1 carbon storage regulator CsrA [Bacteroidota bacterium]
MLVLSRKIGEVITIGNSITVTILSFDRGIVRVGIEAPKNVTVHRKEVYDKIIDMNKQAAQTNVSALKNAMNTLQLQTSVNGNGTTDALSAISSQPINGTFLNGKHENE